MKISKSPVEFANRAEMIACDDRAFSIAGHALQGVVMLNVYAADGSRVLEMTPDEADEIALILRQQAAIVRERGPVERSEAAKQRIADEALASLAAQKAAREAQERADKAAQTDRVTLAGTNAGKPIYTVETPDIGTYQVHNGKVWKHMHAGKLRELSWKKSERAITRVCGAVARYEGQPANEEFTRALEAATRRERQDKGE